ncbi:MAG TPA: 50S ribosomal protein L29 [Candidatus Wolfebacteria bacterium]|nr:50S ribosomal protein L29 [Candidatus Wolfebacteria bacterium]
MKQKDNQQFKNKPLPELRKNLADYHEKLRKLKFDLAAGKVKNIREIKAIKKSIARVLTATSNNNQ